MEKDRRVQRAGREDKELKLVIREKPVSVNECWQGRRYKSGVYLAYEMLILHHLPTPSFTFSGPIAVDYRFFLKHHKTTDYDNLIKPLQDILQKKGYFADDRQIYRASQEKIPSRTDRVEVEIKSL